MVEDAPTYDFICLCCGARNGERPKRCSLNRYVKDENDDSEEYWSQLAQWLASTDYKGALLVPADYELAEDYRLRIVEMTEAFRRSRTGIILFGLPGVEVPAQAVNLTQFLN